MRLCVISHISEVLRTSGILRSSQLLYISLSPFPYSVVSFRSVLTFRSVYSLVSITLHSTNHSPIVPLQVMSSDHSPMKVFSSFHIPVYSPYAPFDYSSYVFPCTYLLRVFLLTIPYWKLRSATVYKLVYIPGSSSVRILLVIVMFPLQYHSRIRGAAHELKPK